MIADSEDSEGLAPAEESTPKSLPETQGDEVGSSADRDDENQDGLTPDQRSLSPDDLRTFVGPHLHGNDFTGDAIIGSSGWTARTIVYQASDSRSSLSLGKVPASTIARLDATFAATESDSRLQEKLKVFPVVFLDGMQGTGRGTSAYLALARRHGTDRVAVLSLSHGVTVAETAHEFAAKLAPGHGHVLRLPNVRGLNRTAVAHLESAAADRQATVVLVGRIAGSRDATLDRLTVPHLVPSPAAVFSSHLRHLLVDACLANCDDCTRTCVTEYIEECLADQKLQEELQSAGLPAECVEIALALAQAGPRSTNIGSILDRVSSSRIRIQAERIMAAHNDIAEPHREERGQHQRAFRICYALFHDKPLRNVFEATDKFMSLLNQSRGRETSERPTVYLSVSELLGEDLAVGNDSPPRQFSGQGRRPWLRNERLVPAILDVAWNEYGGLREPLMKLLNNLAEHPEGLIRKQAASVAGMLASHDIAQISDQLVNEWARSDKQYLRQSAAFAMEVAAHGDDVLRDQVRGQIRSWVGSGSKRSRDAAARVYATRYGLMFPQDTLRDLKWIAVDPMQRQSRVISDAFANLTRRFSVRDLFDVLVSWIDPPSSSVAVHGTRIFTKLATEVDPDPSLDTPVLLSLCAQGEIDHMALSLMWRCALGWPSTARLAWDALETWVSVLDVTDTDHEPVRKLLVDVFSTPALCRRGIFYLNSVWKRRPHDGFKWFTKLIEGD